jgi:hypothetical protein
MAIITLAIKQIENVTCLFAEVIYANRSIEKHADIDRT